jgi:hypothetical protein
MKYTWDWSYTVFLNSQLEEVNGQFYNLVALTLVKLPQYQLNMNLNWPKRRSGRF